MLLWALHWQWDGCKVLRRECLLLESKISAVNRLWFHYLALVYTSGNLLGLHWYPCSDFFFLCAWLGCFIPELGTLCGFSVWMHTLDYGFFGIFGLLLCSTSSSERAAPCHTPTLAFHTAPYLPSPPSLLRFHFIYLLFVPVSSSSAECIVRLQIP